MKKFLLFVISIFLFLYAMNAIIMAEEDKPVLTVEVNTDGSITVTTTYGEHDFSSWDSVDIYKQDDVINPYDPESPGSLVGWYPSNGRVVTYPGYQKYPVYNASDRIAELAAGEGSALLPGKYCAVLSGRNGYLTDPVLFEIPEVTVTPKPSATPAPEKTPARTASPVPTVKSAATPEVTPHTTGKGGKTALWIGLGVAVLVAVGITAIVLVRKKKAKK